MKIKLQNWYDKILLWIIAIFVACIRLLILRNKWFHRYKTNKKKKPWYFLRTRPQCKYLPASSKPLFTGVDIFVLAEHGYERSKRKKITVRINGKRQNNVNNEDLALLGNTCQLKIMLHSYILSMIHVC